MREVTVIRDVASDEYHNFYHEEVKKGKIFYMFDGHTYGCIDWDGGVALSEKPGKNPFFEFPSDAIE